MAIDWGYAVLVSVVGFGLVFVILVILYFVILLTGKVLQKMGLDEPAVENGKK